MERFRSNNGEGERTVPSVRTPLRPQSEALRAALREQYEAMKDPNQAPPIEEVESWRAIRRAANETQISKTPNDA